MLRHVSKSRRAIGSAFLAPGCCPGFRLTLLFSSLLCLLLFAASCRSSEKYPAYSSHENLLSIAAEFALASSLDPYRAPAGEDLTGQAIARSTLVRLGNYEALHPGRLTPEIAALKARALERLGDFESARRNYLEAAEFETPLRDDCIQRAKNLEEMMVARAAPPASADLLGMMEALEARGRELRQLAGKFDDPLYVSLALREAEDADVRRAELMAMNRALIPDGDRQAQQALERVVASHRESRRGLEHAMRLAHFHKALAEEEVRLHPPEQAGFSFDRFKRHYDAAADLLYRVSQADGRPERLVAKHELDAWLQYGEQIQQRAD